MANQIEQDAKAHSELSREREQVRYTRFENTNQLAEARGFVGRLREAVERNGILKYRPELNAMRAKVSALEAENERLNARDLELTKGMAVFIQRDTTARRLARDFDLSDEQRELLTATLATNDERAAKEMASQMNKRNRREASSAITHSFNQAAPGEKMVPW
jgi:hypothetical protein